MTANGLRLTRNVGFPKLTDSSAPASDAAAARKRVTATFAVEFNVRSAFVKLAPGETYANARRNAMPLDHLLLRRLNQTSRKRTVREAHPMTNRCLGSNAERLSVPR